jgi:GNAT superfamily N-acetyltransferase
VKRELAGGFEVDDDRGRIDVDAVHDFVSNHSYWAPGRARDEQERLVREAARVVGLYDGDRQIGFARAVSDGASITYLGDVYVLPEYRGRGLGLELVREMIEHGPLAEKRWILHTKDAHTLYEKFGFGPPSERVMERPRRTESA